MKGRQEVPICVLQTEGTNCDKETAYAFKAFESSSARPRIGNLKEIAKGVENLKDVNIVVLPGGFANGDYGGGAGRILALYLNKHLREQIMEFRERGGIILGICNGFQALLRTGLLPFGDMRSIKAALDINDIGHFRCAPVNLKINEDHIFKPLQDMSGVVSYQAAHGEGKFFAEPNVMQKIEEQNQVVFRYCDVLGNPTQEYPANPNGSLNAIAGICDPSGQILGLMPHPERSVRRTQHPNWRREEFRDLEPQGLPLFQKVVYYVRQM